MGKVRVAQYRSNKARREANRRPPAPPTRHYRPQKIVVHRRTTRIVAALIANVSAADIANDLKVPLSTVVKIARAEGLTYTRLKTSAPRKYTHRFSRARASA